MVEENTVITTEEQFNEPDEMNDDELEEVYKMVSSCPRCGGPIYEISFFNAFGTEYYPPDVYFTCTCRLEK